MPSSFGSKELPNKLNLIEEDSSPRIAQMMIAKE